MTRRLTIGLALGMSIIAFGGFAASADAISCHSWKCVNRQLNSLHSQLRADQRYINTLSSCLSELGVTQYGSTVGSYGYVYDGGTGSTYTTALDLAGGTTPVDHWVMYDSCNVQVFASARRARRAAAAVFGPIAPEGPVSILQVARH
jgi:hypothetical protein